MNCWRICSSPEEERGGFSSEEAALIGNEFIDREIGGEEDLTEMN